MTKLTLGQRHNRLLDLGSNRPRCGEASLLALYYKSVGGTLQGGSTAALHPRQCTHLGHPPRMIGLFRRFSYELNRL